MRHSVVVDGNSVKRKVMLSRGGRKVQLDQHMERERAMDDQFVGQGKTEGGK